MFFLLSKTLFFFLMPIGIGLVFLLWLNLRLRHSKGSLKKVVKLITLFYVLLSNPYLANEAMLIWETSPIEIKDVSERKWAVVLSGVEHIQKSPHDRVHLLRGADRLLHAAVLFHQKKVHNILISGSENFDLKGNKIEHQRSLKEILLLAGVPDSCIFTEPHSKNTYENAKNTAQFFENRQMTEPYLLITSAYHMPRAIACFKKQGQSFIPFSTDFYSMDPKISVLSFIPSEESILLWKRIFHEILGMCVYYFKGYL